MRHSLSLVRYTVPMGRYRARDLLRVPSLISLLRIPLAWAFVVWAKQPWPAMLMLFLGGLTDVVDGWWARHYRQATATGAVVDGITDKAFAAAVVVTLVFEYQLSGVGVLALAARELLELPLVVWWALHRGQRQARAEDPKANWLGKLATTTQFGVAVAVIFGSPWVEPLLALCAAVGLIAAVSYWRRELRTFRSKVRT